MSLKRIGEPENDLKRRFVQVVDGVLIIEEAPPPVYVVTYGCGIGGFRWKDGAYYAYEDHVPGCEHGIESWIEEVNPPSDFDQES